MFRISDNRFAGYNVNSVGTSATGGILASMSMNGNGCKAFGNDIANLMLSVEYETEQRECYFVTLTTLMLKRRYRSPRPHLRCRQEAIPTSKLNLAQARTIQYRRPI